MADRAGGLGRVGGATEALSASRYRDGGGDGGAQPVVRSLVPVGSRSRDRAVDARSVPARLDLLPAELRVGRERRGGPVQGRFLGATSTGKAGRGGRFGAGRPRVRALRVVAAGGDHVSRRRRE